MGLGWVNRVAGQTGHMSKTGHLKRVEIGFRSIELQVGSGRVRFTRIFHMNFFFLFLIKKTTCICHLESYATNYLM